MIQLVVTDVDGTLTDKRGLIEPQAIEALRKLESKNVRVVLCSNQSLPTLLTLRTYFGTTGPCIAEGGAVVGDWGCLYTFGSRAEVQRAYELLSSHFKLVPKPDNELRKVDLAFERNFDGERAQRLLEESDIRVSLVDSGYAYHLLDANVDKGFGLLKLLQLLRVPTSRVVAIGDYFNDIPMLRAAGYAIVVGNAPSAVKAIADYVCRRKYGKGFAEAVKLVLKLKRALLAPG